MADINKLQRMQEIEDEVKRIRDHMVGIVDMLSLEVYGSEKQIKGYTDMLLESARKAEKLNKEREILNEELFGR
jgi:hypothetical protein